MTRQFISMTQDQVDIQIAKAIIAREAELAAYDYEAAQHQYIIDQLSHLEWTQETVKYRGMQRDTMIAACLMDGLDQSVIDRISDLNTLDQHTRLLAAVRVETAKSERYLEHLLHSLPEGERREAAFAVARAEQAA